MINAVDLEFSKEAFGISPPDLSLIVRSRGADWVYTFLTSFYRDDSRPFGVNNTPVSYTHLTLPTNREV